MSQPAAPSTSPSLPDLSAIEKLPLTPSIVIGIAGLFLFLASQLCVLAGATVWAVSGYFHFGTTGVAVLVTVFAAPTVFACWKILVMAIEAERDPVNN